MNTFSRSSAEEPWRVGCAFLESYPLCRLDLHQPLTTNVEDSPFAHFAVAVEGYERWLSRSSAEPDIRLRRFLGDPIAQTYVVDMSDALKQRAAHSVSALLCCYRIFDFEARRLGVGGAVRPVPQTISSGNFTARRIRRYLKPLENWRNIAVAFDKLVRLTERQSALWSPMASPDGKRSSMHLQNLSVGYFTTRLETVATNFRCAAFHLTKLQEFTNTAPRALPNFFDTQDTQSVVDVNNKELEIYTPDIKMLIVNFLTANPKKDIRLPFHLAILVSPLILLLPLDLTLSCSYNTINALSVCIGNQHPALLAGIETEVWKMLLTICDDSSPASILAAFNSFTTSAVFVQVVALPSSDAIFSFYSSNPTMALIQTMSPTYSAGMQIPSVTNNGADRLDESDEEIMSVDDVQLLRGLRDEDMNTDVSPNAPLAVAGNSQIAVQIPPEFHSLGLCIELSAQDENNIQLLNTNHTRQSRLNDNAHASRDSSDSGSSEPLSDIFPGAINDLHSQHKMHDEQDIQDVQMSANDNADIPSPMPSGESELSPSPDSDDREKPMEEGATTTAKNLDISVSRPLTRVRGGVQKSTVPVASRRGERRLVKIAPANGKRTAICKVRQPSYLSRMIVDSSEDVNDGEEGNEADADGNDTENGQEGVGDGLTPAWVKVEEEDFVDAPNAPIAFQNTETPPLITLDRTFTGWGPGGERLDFKPSAHFQPRLNAVAGILQSVENGYKDGKPPHLSTPDNSIFKIYTADEFTKLADSEVQEMYRLRQIILTGEPQNKVDFETALKKLSPFHRMTSLQDQALPPNGDATRPGRVGELLEASIADKPHLLNGLLFPMPMAGIDTSSYSSDSHALNNVMYQEGYPRRDLSIADLRWGLAAVDNVFHLWHIDSDGFGMFIVTITGSKLWIVGSHLGAPSPDVFNDVNFLFEEAFDLDKSGEGLFAAEAILLQPGTRLIMRPNTLHAVYTIEKAVCQGGHFYGTSTIRDTLAGAVHTFICHQYITNISHPPARFLIAQLLNFYHTGLVKNSIDSQDVAQDHIPDPTDPTSYMDLLVACALGCLLNVLSFDTYMAAADRADIPMGEEEASEWAQYDMNDMPEKDRKLCCLARAQSCQIVAWLDATFTIKSGGSSQNIFEELLVDICKRIVHYKWLADKNLVAHHSNFTLDRLKRQIDALLCFQSFSIKEDVDTWALPLFNGQCSILASATNTYQLEQIPNAQFHSLSTKQLFKAGETVLDKRFARRMGIKKEALNIEIAEDGPLEKKRKRVM